MVSRNGKVSIAGTPWANRHERELAKVYIARIFEERQVVAYSFLSEAWKAEAPKDWVPGQALPVLPADNPDRIEVVIAMASDGKNEQWKTWKIKRDHNERVIALELWDVLCRPMMGWVSELLK